MNQTFMGVNAREIDTVIRKTVSKFFGRCDQDLVQEAWVALLSRKAKKGYSPEVLASLTAKTVVLDAKRKFSRRDDLGHIESGPTDEGGSDLIENMPSRGDYDPFEMVEIEYDLERENPELLERAKSGEYFQRSLDTRGRKSAADLFLAAMKELRNPAPKEQFLPGFEFC